jgi:Family of unknown function (DUF5670)
MTALSSALKPLDEEFIMLWTIFVSLLALWLVGIVSANTFGGFIHVLLMVAVGVVLLRAIQGHRPI